MKAVFFDFDGTLTKDGSNIWKDIWVDCGYSTSKGSYFSQLYNAFNSGSITHKQWCDLTCQAFAEANFNIADLYDLSCKIKIIDGAEETFKALKDNGYSLHLVSGNIVPVMRQALGKSSKYFDSINGNEMQFDENGDICAIDSTDYDYEGKAKFISEWQQKTHCDPKDLLFIGNGENDEWVHKSGCRTLCINPDNTDDSDRTKWHNSLGKIDNLTEILPLCNIKDDVMENE